MDGSKAVFGMGTPGCGCVKESDLVGVVLKFASGNPLLKGSSIENIEERIGTESLHNRLDTVFKL